MSAKKGITNTLVWILMGLLIVGLGGFGVTNLGGSINSIGSVGETKISLQDYARDLRNEINAEAAERQRPVSFQAAREMGLDQRVLGQLVQAAAFEEEARLMGVSIGDENLRDQIMSISAFRGVDGSFDREAYRFTLQRSDLTESQFEERLRAEAARSLLQSAILAGVTMPDSYTELLVRHVGEERVVSFATQDRSALSIGVPVPTEQDLVNYHQTHLPDFTTPRVKRITYAWLTPDMIIDSIEVDEASLREAYEDSARELNQPERRLVERLVFGSMTEAETALRDVREDGGSFEQLIEARGLEIADADMGDVSREDLGPAAEAVFAASVGEVVGPLTTALGPALFRVNGILDPVTVSLEEIEDDLRRMLASDRARRVIDNQVDGMADLFAAGATLEDLSDESEMVLGQIDWHEGVREGIAAYDNFRDSARDLTADDFPRIEELSGGGIFAMRLDSIIDPQIQPLDEVRDRVEAGWRSGAIAEALREQLESALPALRDGAPFEEFGLIGTTTVPVTRSGHEEGAPPEFIETVFSLEQGEVTILEGDARIFVLRLDAINPPDPQDPDMIRLSRALSQDAASGLAQDLFALISTDIRARAGVNLDQQALNAVHSNLQ